MGGNGGTIVLPSKQIPICPPFKQETFFQARDMMEQDEIISGPDLGTAGASEGWVSGILKLICLRKCPKLPFPDLTALLTRSDRLPDRMPWSK